MHKLLQPRNKMNRPLNGYDSELDSGNRNTDRAASSLNAKRRRADSGENPIVSYKRTPSPSLVNRLSTEKSRYPYVNMKIIKNGKTGRILNYYEISKRYRVKYQDHSKEEIKANEAQRFSLSEWTLEDHEQFDIIDSATEYDIFKPIQWETVQNDGSNINPQAHSKGAKTVTVHPQASKQIKEQDSMDYEIVWDIPVLYWGSSRNDYDPTVINAQHLICHKYGWTKEENDFLREHHQQLLVTTSQFDAEIVAKSVIKTMRAIYQSTGRCTIAQYFHLAHVAASLDEPLTRMIRQINSLHHEFIEESISCLAEKRSRPPTCMLTSAIEQRKEHINVLAADKQNSTSRFDVKTAFSFERLESIGKEKKVTKPQMTNVKSVTVEPCNVGDQELTVRQVGLVNSSSELSTNGIPSDSTIQTSWSQNNLQTTVSTYIDLNHNIFTPILQSTSASTSENKTYIALSQPTMEAPNIQIKVVNTPLQPGEVGNDESLLCSDVLVSPTKVTLIKNNTPVFNRPATSTTGYSSSLNPHQILPSMDVCAGTVNSCNTQPNAANIKAATNIGTHLQQSYVGNHEPLLGSDMLASRPEISETSKDIGSHVDKVTLTQNNTPVLNRPRNSTTSGSSLIKPHQILPSIDVSTGTVKPPKARTLVNTSLTIADRMFSSQASYAGTPETHNSSYIIVNEHACLESNYWRSEDDSPLLEDRSYEVFHLPSNILNGETDFPVSQAAETLNTSLEKKFNETMANQQSVLPDSDTITNVNMDWSRTVNGVVKRYQLSLNHTKQGLERRVRGLKSNCTESMGNAIVVNLNEMLVKKHYTVAPTISDLLFPEKGNENQVFLVLGYITGWESMKRSAGKPARLYVVVVPGEWSVSTLQFVTAATTETFYKAVVISKAFRRLSENTKTYVLSNGRSFTLYTRLLVYSVVRLLNKVTYKANELEDMYDSAIGYVPRRTHLVEHAVTKKAHRSVRLGMDLLNMLKREDEQASKQNRYWRQLKLRLVPSGVARARDAYDVIPASYTIPVIHEDLSGNRSTFLRKHIADSALFAYELNPADLANAFKDFEEWVYGQEADNLRARRHIGCVYALLGQQLWWTIAPPVSQPLQINEMALDLDFQQTIGEYDWMEVVQRTGESFDLGKRPFDLVDEHGNPSETCVFFLTFWAGIITEQILLMKSRSLRGRERGIFFTWESFARQPAFVTSTTARDAKKGWYHIPTNGGHSDACHMSMKPVNQRGDPIDTDSYIVKDNMFRCMITISSFLNRFWSDNSYDVNTNDDYLTNMDERAKHKWSVYGGLTMPLLLPLLYGVVYKTNVVIAIQTFGGKRTGMSRQVLDLSALKADPCSIGSQCFEQLWNANNNRIVFIVHRLVDFMTQKLPVMYSGESIKMEDGVGVTITGSVPDISGNQQRAFVVFGSSIKKSNVIKQESDIDEGSLSEEDNASICTEASDSSNELLEDDAIVEHQELHDELVEANSRLNDLSTFYPFSGMFCSANVMQNLSRKEQLALKETLQLKSDFVNGQIYCPSLNNPTCPPAALSFGVKDITSADGIMNTTTAVENSSKFFQFIYDNVFKKFIDKPHRFPLGRMEVRTRQDQNKPEALRETFCDLATIAAREVRGYPADTYLQLSMFSVMALEGMHAARFQLQQQLHDPRIYKEWIEVIFEIRAHAYTMLSGRAKGGFSYMFSAKDQQRGHRAIYSMLHPEFNRILGDIADGGSSTLLNRLLELIIKHNKLSLSVDDILVMNRNIFKQVQEQELYLANPSRMRIRQLLHKLWDSTDGQRCCRYCRRCFILFPPDTDNYYNTKAAKMFAEHGCIAQYSRTFASREQVGFTNTVQYRKWLLHEVDCLDDCQLHLLRLVYINNPPHLTIIGGAGKGKSKLISIMRHVLVQRDGYDAVSAQSMLKANAIKHNVSTLNSYYQLPVDNERLNKLVDPKDHGQNARVHIVNEYGDDKKTRLRRVQVIMQDEVSSMTASMHTFLHEIHSQLNIGGDIPVHSIQAMDPLQNPTFRGETPFYTTSFFARNYHVAMMMDPGTNHRFDRISEWNRLLNLIRTLKFESSEDEIGYCNMIGGVLGGRTGNAPQYHDDPVTTVIDCANTIALNELRKSMAKSNYTSTFKHEDQMKNGFLVRERVDPLLATLAELNRSIGGATTDSIKLHYERLMGSPFCESHFYSKRIVVTESIQVKAYELLLGSLMIEEHNVHAVDTWFRSINGIDFVPITAMEMPSLVSDTLKKKMASDHHLDSVVNLAPGSIRCISSNDAGLFLVKGMRVDILSFDAMSGSLVVKPYDISGQNLVYNTLSLMRTEQSTVCRDRHIHFKLTRKQFPITVGCASTASSIAGLTFSEPVVLDNTRTAQAATFYIFNGRNKNPKMVYLRHRLFPALNPNRPDSNRSKQGHYFDIKADITGLAFNAKAEELWQALDVTPSGRDIVVPATVFASCTNCLNFICSCKT